MITRNSKIFIAGHNGLVGNAIYQKLKSKKYKRLIVKDKIKLDLLNTKKVDIFFKKKKPDFLIMCAAKVGGILENKNYQLLDYLLPSEDLEDLSKIQEMSASIEGYDFINLITKYDIQDYIILII